MAESPLAAIVSRLVRGLPTADGTGDDALLARFVGWRDEAAFELVVYRHGPMVRALCHRILRHEQDAEDAFQATFLALAKKAAAIRGKSLAGWLYRVAFHAALKAKARSARRETNLPDIVATNGQVGQDQELRAVLDDEILRLPERFRVPVLLCYLQGRSNSEAAAALGIPKGTVDSRLATARQRLRVRLIRRGLAPAVAAAAVEGTIDAAEVPGAVARAVTKAAVAFLSKEVAPATTAAVLAEGVLHTMILTKLTWTMAAALALTVLGSGAGMATYGALKDEKPPNKVTTEAKPIAKDLSPRESPQRPAPRLNTHTYAAICDFLQQTVSIDKSIENAPLKEVLEFLTDKYGVTFIVDTMAFEQAGVGGGRNVQDCPVTVPRMPEVSLSTVLRFLLTQVHGAYLVRKDYVEITTRDRQIIEAFGPIGPRDEFLGVDGDRLPQTVNVVFEAKPLDRALADLASQTGKNIVLDPRVQKKEDLSVSARLINTPIDAAVVVVTDMVGLQPVTIGNVIYVTTKDNAHRLIEDRAVKPVTGAAPRDE
jgi:RNA polymerase sigma factor (sigma-70 family)